MATIPKGPTNRFWDFLVLWPFIFIALFFMGGIILAAASGISDAGEPPMLLWAAIPIFVILYIATIIGAITSYVYAIHRLYTQTNLDDDTKKMWLILVILFNIITIPILHFMHLRR